MQWIILIGIILIFAVNLLTNIYLLALITVHHEMKEIKLLKEYSDLYLRYRVAVVQIKEMITAGGIGEED